MRRNNLFKNKNYYEILGLRSITASPEELKDAYKKKMRSSHPDKHLDNKEVATTTTKDIVEAYETLINPISREKYDKYFAAIPGHSMFFPAKQKEFKALQLLKRKKISELPEADKITFQIVFFYEMASNLKMELDWLKDEPWISNKHLKLSTEMIHFLSLISNFSAIKPQQMINYKTLRHKQYDTFQSRITTFEKIFTFELLQKIESWIKNIHTTYIVSKINKFYTALQDTYTIYYLNNKINPTHYLFQLCENPITKIIELEEEIFYETCENLYQSYCSRNKAPDTNDIKNQMIELIRSCPHILNPIAIIETAKEGILHPVLDNLQWINEEYIEAIELTMKEACKETLKEDSLYTAQKPQV